ncbi:MAG: Na+/H+ antiporter subunit D [Proteobacteria bacterium]|nr:Na+/H+ antiporter subunit D [Pseudomonadota bacterium]
MSGLLVAPLLIPLSAAVAGALGWGSARLQRVIGVAGAAALLLAAGALFTEVRSAGVVAVQVGSWPAPYGITLVADLLTSLMVLVTAVVGLAVSVYATTEADEASLAAGFFPCFHVLLMGVCGAFLTGDLFNLYVWFEVLLIASFVLLGLSGRPNALASGIAYVALNLLASAFFLVAVGILYGEAGSLNLADLATKLRAPGAEEATRPVAMLLLVAFGIKAGLFPVFFWLPAAYPTAGFAVSALFAGLLTKVGVYALIRVFTLLFPVGDGWLGPLLLWVSVATMASGVLAAASQVSVRRILSFHIVSQIGYMVLGLALATPLALAGAVFYVIHHIVTKTNLFLVSGLIARAGGGEGLARLGGLGGRGALLAILFAVPALSLAGVPPLSGFFAKLFLIRAGLAAEAFAAVAVALAVGLMTVFSMTKIWNEAFWKPAPHASAGGDRALPPVAVAASGALAAVTVTLGLGAEALWSVAERAAEQLYAPDLYLRTVLETRP